MLCTTCTMRYRLHKWPVTFEHRRCIYALYLCQMVCFFLIGMGPYDLATSMVISGFAPTCDSQHLDLIYHSITLFCFEANYSLHSASNVKNRTGWWQVSIFVSHWVESARILNYEVQHRKLAL